MEIFQSSFHDQRNGTRACNPLIGSFKKTSTKWDFNFMNLFRCENHSRLPQGYPKTQQSELQQCDVFIRSI